MNRRGGPQRASREIAVMASSNFSWAASPPSLTAAATQCSRWSLRRAIETALRALVTAEIWAGDAPGLPLYQAQTPQIGLFVGGVAVLRMAALVILFHDQDNTPQG